MVWVRDVGVRVFVKLGGTEDASHRRGCAKKDKRLPDSSIMTASRRILQVANELMLDSLGRELGCILCASV